MREEQPHPSDREAELEARLAIALADRARLREAVEDVLHRLARIADSGAVDAVNVLRAAIAEGESAGDDRVICSFRWGTYEQITAGPFVWPRDLNLGPQIERFIDHRHRLAEAAGEDFCPLSVGDFVDWLLTQGVLSPLGCHDRSIEIGDNPTYEPRHWPACPVCGEGWGGGNDGAGASRTQLGNLVPALHQVRPRMESA